MLKLLSILILTILATTIHASTPIKQSSKDIANWWLTATPKERVNFLEIIEDRDGSAYQEKDGWYINPKITIKNIPKKITEYAGPKPKNIIGHKWIAKDIDGGNCEANWEWVLEKEIK